MWSLFKRRASPPTSVEVEDNPVLDNDFHLSTALLTDIGCERSTNEDSGRIVHPDTLSPDGKGFLAVVADGMGGHNAGDTASQLTVETVSRIYQEGPGPPAQSLAAALIEANTAVYELAAADSRLNGMGTTCTALAITNGFAYMAHVGDSRLYLIRNGEIYQMTEDHTHVMELVRRGVITSEQAREHPDRNVLHRAIGRHPYVQVDSWSAGSPVRDGDCYLLCSDGLSGVLPDETIREVAMGNSPQAACAELVALTRRAGAPDNITVCIVKARSVADRDTGLPATREFGMPPRENGEDGANLP